uniref:DUF834 domain-containing protein n=1 Tax=Oryza meridionalis TaxID=40149 RepID=A0A0E0CZ35_9ORYZ
MAGEQSQSRREGPSARQQQRQTGTLAELDEDGAATSDLGSLRDGSEEAARQRRRSGPMTTAAVEVLAKVVGEDDGAGVATVVDGVCGGGRWAAEAEVQGAGLVGANGGGPVAAGGRSRRRRRQILPGGVEGGRCARPPCAPVTRCRSATETGPRAAWMGHNGDGVPTSSDPGAGLGACYCFLLDSMTTTQIRLDDAEEIEIDLGREA